jgi:lambda family phage tail tape measure protein
MAKTEVGIVFKAYDQATAQINTLGLSLNKLGGTLRTTAAALGIGLGLGAAIRQFKSWIEAAKEAEATQRIFNLALGANAAAAGDWADRYSKSAGVSGEATRQLLTTQQMLAEDLGLSADQALQTGEALTRLANDTASFTRGTVTAPEALQKFSAAMQGNYKGLQSLGLKMTETMVTEYALREGWIKQGQEMSRAQKAAAAFNLTLDHTEKIQGDLERSAGSAADQERRLKEEWKDLKKEFGDNLMPVYQKGLQDLHETLRAHVQDLRDIAEGIAIAGNAVLGAEGWLAGRTKAYVDMWADVPQQIRESNKYYSYTGDADRAAARIHSRVPSWDEILPPPSNPRPYGPNEPWSSYSIYDYQESPEIPPGAQNTETYGPVLAGSDYSRLGNPGGETDPERVRREEEQANDARLNAYRHMYDQMDQRSEQSYAARIEALQHERDEYQEITKDKAVTDQWYAEQWRKLQIERAQGSDDFFAGWHAGVMQMQDDLETLGEMGAESAKMMRDAWVEGTYEMIAEGRKASDVWKSFVRDWSRMMYTKTMNQLVTQGFNAIGSYFGGGSGSGGSGNGKGSGSGSFAVVSGEIAPEALGNAFYGGRIQRYAQGGIVTQPTVFRMERGAGLMGEAGPEGVLPLQRDRSGRLGVSAAGSPTQLEVHVHNYSSQGLEVETGEIRRENDRLVMSVIARDRRRRGASSMGGMMR